MTETISVAHLRDGDKIEATSGHLLTVIGNPRPGKNGWLVQIHHDRLSGHDADRGYEQWYVSTITGRMV